MGWAIPTATDIAFALAILAIISTHLPTALRTFLLTLAVVDDLVAVTIIAVFYTDDLQAAAAGRRAGSARSVRARRTAPDPLLVAAHPAGRRHLGARPRVRHPRHRRGCAAGLHRSGHPFPGRRRPRGRTRARRTLRAPHPPDLSRRRGADLRVLRRRRRDRRPRRTDRVAHRPDRARDHRRTRARQAHRHPRHRLAGRPVHPRQPRRRTRTGSTCSACPSWAGSGSPSPSSSATSPSGPAAAPTSTSRSGSWPGRLLAALLAAVLVKSRDRTYRRIEAAERLDTDADGIPDAYEHPRRTSTGNDTDPRP